MNHTDTGDWQGWRSRTGWRTGQPDEPEQQEGQDIQVNPNDHSWVSNGETSIKRMRQSRNNQMESTNNEP